MLHNKLLFTGIFLSLSLFSSAQAEEKSDGWHLVATDTVGYTGVTLANGSIGLQTGRNPFEVQSVVLNHVFDIADNQVSKVMQGINPFRLSLIVDGDTIRLKDMSRWTQTLDMKFATLTTSFVLPQKVEVRCSATTLRNVAYSGLIHLSIFPLQDIQVSLYTEMSVPAQEYRSPQKEYRTIGEKADGPIFCAYRLCLEEGNKVFAPVRRFFTIPPAGDTKEIRSRLPLP